MSWNKQQHAQAVEVVDQEIKVNGKPYWVEARANVTGVLTEDSQSLECHGAPCTLTQFFFDATEADVYEFNIVELDAEGNETEVTDAATIAAAKKQVEEMAMEDAEKNFEV
jgi:hypothetical protein